MMFIASVALDLLIVIAAMALMGVVTIVRIIKNRKFYQDNHISVLFIIAFFPFIMILETWSAMRLNLKSMWCVFRQSMRR